MDAPTLERHAREPAERRLVEPARVVELVSLLVGTGIRARELRERRDPHAEPAEAFDGAGRRKRCGGDRPNERVEPRGLLEAASRDEVRAGGLIAHPQTDDQSPARHELGLETRPDRRADAATSFGRVDRDAQEITPWLVAARLVIDLAVPDRHILLVDGD